MQRLLDILVWVVMLAVVAAILYFTPYAIRLVNEYGRSY